MRIWCDLDHPNILQFIGFHLSEDLDSALLVSPWEPLGNIDQYIKAQSPDEHERLDLVS